MIEKRFFILDTVEFILKTIVLFCFFYDFVTFYIPSPLFSSRKVGFVIVLTYFIFKRYSFRTFFVDKELKKIIFVTIICLLYGIILMMLTSGTGTSVIVWYVYFLVYSLIGAVLFAGFFDWDFEKLIKAISIVTLAQAIWCILTYYFDEIRLLNSTWFVIDEEENIDFLAMQRLRSIGAAGAGLSVRLATSSMSFLYFILKRKNVLFNIVSLILTLFATFLAGSTGTFVIFVLISVTTYLLYKGSKYGLIPSLLIILSVLFFFKNTDSFFDEKQYDDLTYKMVSFYEEGSESITVRALTEEQKVPDLSLETVVGTGLSRGKTITGERCYHDSGYVRNYFGIGLIMSVVFYIFLYTSMFRMARKVASPIQILLLFYIISCMIIEFKEPFIFAYISPFIFFTLVFAESSLFKQQ